MKIGAAIVTYGDKSHFKGIRTSLNVLEEVSQIKKIFIIQNGCQYDLRSRLNNLHMKKQITLIVNERNNGSAGGFSQALKFGVSQTDIDHILLMDDDTRLAEDAISIIEEYETRNDLTTKHIWSLFREKRYGRENFKKNWDYNLNYFKNRYVSFSFGQLFNKKNMITIRKDKRLSNLLYAPYAGMLISTFVLEDVGFPNPNYYLYADDIDYSLKLKKNGYKIYQLEDAKLDDLSASWNDQSKHSASSFFKRNTNSGRYLYDIRNRVYLIHDNNLVTNKFVFFLNGLVYKSVVFFIFMPKTQWGFHRYKQVLKALKDGEKGVLGSRDDYSI